MIIPDEAKRLVQWAYLTVLSALMVRAEDDSDLKRQQTAAKIIEQLWAESGGDSGDPVKAMHHFPAKVLKWAAEHLKD
jgi:hypothetical protein